MDNASEKGEAVVEGYAEHGGIFSGDIEKVVIDIDPNADHDPELIIRAKYRKQQLSIRLS